MKSFFKWKNRISVQHARTFGCCRLFYRKYKRVEFMSNFELDKEARDGGCMRVYGASVAKSCFPSTKNPMVAIYLDADILQQNPLNISWADVRYAKRDWKKALRHIIMYGFPEWWCHRNSLQEQWDERISRCNDGYELLQAIKQKEDKKDISFRDYKAAGPQ